jgi:hypothetical protein
VADPVDCSIRPTRARIGDGRKWRSVKSLSSMGAFSLLSATQAVKLRISTSTEEPTPARRSSTVSITSSSIKYSLQFGHCRTGRSLMMTAESSQREGETGGHVLHFGPSPAWYFSGRLNCRPCSTGVPWDAEIVGTCRVVSTGKGLQFRRATDGRREGLSATAPCPDRRGILFRVPGSALRTTPGHHRLPVGRGIGT